MSLDGVSAGEGGEHGGYGGGGGEGLGAVAPTSLRVGSDHLCGAVGVDCGGRGGSEQEDPDAFWYSLILQRERPLPAALAATFKT